MVRYRYLDTTLIRRRAELDISIQLKPLLFKSLERLPSLRFTLKALDFCCIGRFNETLNELAAVAPHVTL